MAGSAPPCLGWDTRYRSTKDAPSLILSLDRGGQCKTVAFPCRPRLVTGISPNSTGVFYGVPPINS
jgi:hypothetical protein